MVSYLWTLALAAAAALTSLCNAHVGVGFEVSNADPVDVFVSGEEGYPCYRIPAVLRLTSGTLLLFAEGRRGGDTGPNDIVYKASTDEGATWSPLRVLHSEWQPPGHGWHTFVKNTTLNTTYTEQNGFYADGHDIMPPANVTLAIAETSCKVNPKCIGFSFYSYDPRPVQPVKVYFKAAGAGFVPTPGGSGACIHNPCPVLANGRAMVIFGRNR